MYMTTVALAATEGAPQRRLDSNLVVDLLWALAAPELGIQHLRVVTGPGRIRLVVFSVAADARSGALAGKSLCENAIRSAPQLRGWYVEPGAADRPVARSD
ncbi:hypothetical protein QRX60_27405 [Amycolatopsis mongoliensis]|uniref:Uncharacterized protein n=1 Tax=Amycolatopsis mongoliensis TaxID=715475 RepID=A0A9Y2JG18_9PSEU|nr:hypothetical protein [Amycolatopsis sp. 4-36]WIX97814.1 hypothetical protein QRX60_27405 [Amycolatopsis sp. 4-36]